MYAIQQMTLKQIEHYSKENNVDLIIKQTQEEN